MKTSNKSAEALKITCLILSLVSSFFLLAGCIAATDSSVVPAASALDATELEHQNEKLSYALGMVLGNQFRGSSVELDLDFYARGLKDGFSGGRTLLTETEARVAIGVLQRELQRKQVAVPDTAPPDIKVSFKLDTRLTRGVYMGDRWVSPPTFTQVGEGKEVIVEAIVKGLDSMGRLAKISPEWIAEDPDMVTITPGQGNKVKITVRRAGQSKLKVVSAEISRELDIKAMYRDDTLQVEISQ
jgi:hypothetical protein